MIKQLHFKILFSIQIQQFSDILLNMNTSYFNNGFLLKNQKAILIIHDFFWISQQPKGDYHHWGIFQNMLPQYLSVFY